MISPDRLATVLDQLPRLTIGLVGDLFLDRYLEIDPRAGERSLETGLEAYQVTRIRNSPGALGTVLNNLAALGVGTLLPVSVIGDDGHGYDLVRAVTQLGVETSCLVRSAERPTPTYTKPVVPEPAHSAEGVAGATVWRELNRLDVRPREMLSETAHHALVAAIEQMLGRVDGVIVLDQICEPNWGVVDDPIRAFLGESARRRPDLLFFVDSRAHLGSFEFGSLKGNRTEVVRAAGYENETPDRVAEAARRLARRTQRVCYCTLGAEGILLAEPDGTVRTAPGCPISGPVDIVGAGDSATSGMVSALLAGATPLEAAAVGNLVASITVQQLGTTGTATPDQIRARRDAMSRP